MKSGPGRGSGHQAGSQMALDGTAGSQHTFTVQLGFAWNLALDSQSPSLLLFCHALGGAQN